MNWIFAIDDFTLIVSFVVIVIAAVSCFFSPFVRFRKSDGEAEAMDGFYAVAQDGDAGGENATKRPKITIILTPHDEADRLERNLSLLLQQKYPAGFQVVVVMEEGARDTEDLLKRMQLQLNEHPGDGSLYYSYIPASSRYLSRKKLAITVGVKAASTDWVLLTEASSYPSSDYWLATMAGNCNNNNRVVIGYGNYSDQTSSFKRFERLYGAYYLMREDSCGKPYRTQSHNLMFRKSDFMENDGFLGNLNLIRGEYDFIVNKFATSGATALVTDNSAWMTDENPSRKAWLTEHIFYMETRRWLSGSWLHRFWFNSDQLLLHVSLLLIVFAAAFAVFTLNLTLLCAAAFAFVVSWTVRTILGYKALRSFSERMPLLFIYPYELSLVWHNLAYAIHHRFSDKLDFSTHKQ